LVEYDLLIRGGQALDPGSGLQGRMDVAIADGRIAAIGSGLAPDSAGEALDATGALVTPGLIDLHTHVGFKLHGQMVVADEVCPPSGVTTAVDLGTTGAYTAGWYRENSVANSSTRLRAFVNVASIGTLGAHSPYYVQRYGQYVDVDETIEAIEANRDYIRGIKTFAASTLTGGWPLFALDAARQVADAVGLPIAVHVSGEEPPLEEVLPRLSAGDIMTHTYTPHRQRILDEEGRVRDVVWDARQRGVLFDLGHGMGSFSYDVARRALDQGFVPDTISTDLYYANRVAPVKDLVTTLSKLLNLGLALEDVLLRATARPAQALGEPEPGALRVGAPADIALLNVEQGEFQFVDVLGELLSAAQRIVCLVTVRDGQIVYQKGDA
jgi:dihydroorotase